MLQLLVRTIVARVLLARVLYTIHALVVYVACRIYTV